MKVLFIYDRLPGTFQKYLSAINKSLKEKLGVKILTYDASSGADFNIRTFGYRDQLRRILFRLGLSKSKSLDIKIMSEFDIVHFQISYLKEKIRPLLNLSSRPKVVLTLRGGDTYIKPWLFENWRAFYNECGNNLDAIITVSEHQKNYLKRWGIDASKIHVIPVSFGHKNNAAPKHPSSEVLRIISAFRMTWEKNIDSCIQFALKLLERGINFQYDIIGEGEDLGQLYYLVERNQLQDKIRILGKIENAELKEKLKEYDFFLQLSISEALSASVIEAQSVGLPCIVSDSDGLPEAVIPNKSAVVADYHMIDYFVEECLRIWKDRELYYSYSKCAIENANENFSIEKETERLISLYQSLTNKK